MSTTRRHFFTQLALAGAATAASCRGRAPMRSPALASQARPTACAEPAPRVGIDVLRSGGTGASGTSSTRFAQLAGFCDGIPSVSEGEHAARIERGRKAAAERGCDGMLLEAGVSQRYFTGLRWGLSERPLLLWIPSSGPPVWICPAFEEGTLRERLPASATVRVWEEHERPYSQVAGLLPERGRRRAKVAVDPMMRSFVVAGLQLASRGTRWDTRAGAVEACRIVKTDLELARLRRANEATKAALKAAASHLTLGMTQAAFRELVHEAQQVAGLGGVWSLVLFGPNAAFPHGTEEDRAIREGELVLVDTGGDLHGYQSDISRTWAWGDPDDAQRRAWDTVHRAQTAAMAEIRPGSACGDADKAARKVMAEAGYGVNYEHFTHRLGHGIGMQGHEAPYLVRDSERKLRVGMTTSNEPGIYVPGAFGVRIEDIVAVTESGNEVFGARSSALDAPFG
ncbi:MAG: Xaa-Pro peptidase family protein [Nannocystaceae bacterium]